MDTKGDQTLTGYTLFPFHQIINDVNELPTSFMSESTSTSTARILEKFGIPAQENTEDREIRFFTGNALHYVTNIQGEKVHYGFNVDLINDVLVKVSEFNNYVMQYLAYEFKDPMVKQSIHPKTLGRQLFCQTEEGLASDKRTLDVYTKYEGNPRSFRPVNGPDI